MIILFHMDHDKHPAITRELRSPHTAEMTAIGERMGKVDWSKPTPEQRALAQQREDLRRAELVRLAAALFELGGYVRVAEIEGDAGYAYKATQNGVLSPSWSREPPEGVRPCDPCFHEHDGRRYSRKSSEIGDVLLIDGGLFVVDTVGFTSVPMPDKLLRLEQHTPGWRSMAHACGSRSILDDVDD